MHRRIIDFRVDQRSRSSCQTGDGRASRSASYIITGVRYGGGGGGSVCDGRKEQGGLVVSRWVEKTSPCLHVDVSFVSHFRSHRGIFAPISLLFASWIFHSDSLYVHLFVCKIFVNKSGLREFVLYYVRYLNFN